jgi:DNA-binding CsgD family transcriptional regulator/PAS domain-containing protein
VAISEELVQTAHLKRTEFYNDYLLPQDTVHQFGGAILKAGAWCAGFTCLRPHHRGPFGEDEVALLRLLFPHLQRAVQMERKIAELEGQHQASLDALNRLPIGVWLLDGRGKILMENRHGQRLLDQNDGLTARRDGLAASIPDEHKKLHLLIAESALTAMGDGFSSGGLLGISRPSGKRPFSVLIMPASRSAFRMSSRNPAVIVFVSDPDENTPRAAELLTRIYGLTAAESKLAAQLMQGETLVHAAEHLGVSHNTARTHLQKIYQKTNTSHQGDLVRVLLGGTLHL